jgi:hypothetical protein
MGGSNLVSGTAKCSLILKVQDMMNLKQWKRLASKASKMTMSPKVNNLSSHCFLFGDNCKVRLRDKIGGIHNTA